MLDNNQVVYPFSFKKADGEDLKLSIFQGQVLLIVNTASRCGFTKQYKNLQALYEQYKASGLVVIAVPSNDFFGQEPDDNDQIQKFCTLDYGITFPVVQKEHVSGVAAHPFYVWAKKELGFGSAPKWNFHKYLLDRQGQLVDYFYSTTTPENPRMLKRIEYYLNIQ